MRSALLVMLALLCVCAGCSNPEPRPQTVPIIVIVKPRPPLKPIVAPEKVVVLDFYATWCGPCIRNAPKINALEAEGVTITRIDIDQSPGLAHAWRVISYPTYIITINGRQSFRTHDPDLLRAKLGK